MLLVSLAFNLLRTTSGQPALRAAERRDDVT
jgi:hypothetical protein